MRYQWPGNVRELRNVVERAVLLANGATIEPWHLPADRMGRSLPPPPRVPAAWGGSTPAAAWSIPGSSANGADDDDARARIVAALEKCAGNQTQAAKLLGVSRRTLINRIEQFGLPRPKRSVAE